jgi:hypothetical protein
VDARMFRRCRGRAVLAFSHSGLRLNDGVVCVILWIGFVLSPIVGDTAHDVSWVIATREGTVGIYPILFGLTSVSGRVFA